MARIFQKYHLKWPWTPRQVENLDEMLSELFTDVAGLSLTVNQTPAASPTGSGASGPPGSDGGDGEDGPPGPPGVRGLQGIQGIQGLTGAGVPGYNGLDGEDGLDGWPGPPGATGAAGSSSRTTSMGIVLDGAGSALTTGIKGDLFVPVACTILSVTMLADQSGSIVVDVWKDTYANYPPTVADTITAAAKPTISTATKSQDTTLTGWTTAVSAGDTIRFNVDSITTITRLTLSLKVSVP